MKKNVCKACYYIVHDIATKRTVKHTCFKTEEEISKLKRDVIVQKFYDKLKYKSD